MSEMRAMQSQLDRLAEDLEELADELLRTESPAHRHEIADLDAIVRCVRGIRRGHGDPLATYR